LTTMQMRRPLHNFGSVVPKSARSETLFWFWWKQVLAPGLCLMDKFIEEKRVLPGSLAT
jgi:hypothetical protein